MKITREQLTSYLLTLQLVEAGYHITYDELMDEIAMKEFLSVPKKDRKLFFQGKLKLHELRPSYVWFEEYTITSEQENKWFDKAIKITQNKLKYPYYVAKEYVAWLNLKKGLRIKG